MKFLLLLSALLATVSCRCPGSTANKVHNYDDLLQKVTLKYKGGPGLEDLKRRSKRSYVLHKASFAKAVALADSINANSALSFSAEYNHLALMSDEEKAQLMGLQNVTEVMAFEKRSGHRQRQKAMLVEKREEASIDWVARGALQSVKNQGQCGSCWAFGANAPTEANYYILTGEKKRFSEQEYLDCSVSYNGCGGGWMGSCYDYNIRTGHMSLEADAGYTATSEGSGTGACKWASNTNAFSKAKVTSQVRVTQSDTGLQSALQDGIVTVALFCSNGFNTYKTGVMDCSSMSDCFNAPNHAVAVVGYGTQSGIRYWNVRNSWGDGWGDGGYIKITRDDANKNMVNIHAYAGVKPILTCKAGQTCTTPSWDESSHEDDTIEEDKGADVQCGTLTHSGGRCLSIDDTASKFLDLSAVCEREWCITDKGYLYEKATDLCANFSPAPTDCADSKTSCSYWAGLGYCTHSYVSYMESNCASSCNMCVPRVRVQGACTTKWQKTSAGNIKSQDDNTCMKPKNGAASPAEGEAIIPDADCSAAFEWSTPNCWEIEDGKKLTGGANYGSCEDQSTSCGYWAGLGYCTHSYVSWMNSNCPASCDKCSPVIQTLSKGAYAKQRCAENDACGGINYEASTGKYHLVTSTTLTASAAADKVIQAVSCDEACNAGEERCQDGDCKAECPVECDTAGGLRLCPDGTCKHVHMDC